MTSARAILRIMRHLQGERLQMTGFHSCAP
jgi:hypothetical protein